VDWAARATIALTVRPSTRQRAPLSDTRRSTWAQAHTRTLDMWTRRRSQWTRDRSRGSLQRDHLAFPFKHRKLRAYGTTLCYIQEGSRHGRRQPSGSCAAYGRAYDQKYKKEKTSNRREDRGSFDVLIRYERWKSIRQHKTSNGTDDTISRTRDPKSTRRRSRTSACADPERRRQEERYARSGA